MIAAETEIVADHAPRLTGLVVAAEGRTGGDADDAVEAEMLLHHRIQHPGGEERAHRAAFEHQPDPAPFRTVRHPNISFRSAFPGLG